MHHIIVAMVSCTCSLASQTYCRRRGRGRRKYIWHAIRLARKTRYHVGYNWSGIRSSFTVVNLYSSSGFHLGISPWGDRVAIGHGKGGCAPSCVECKRKFYLFLEDSPTILANANTKGDFFLGEEIL